MNKTKTLLLVFLAAILFRVFYTLAAPNIFSNVDSAGYYGLGQGMVTEPGKHLIGAYRTPLYPVFINAIMYAVGVGGAPFDSPGYHFGTQFVAVVQMFIGAVAFVIFFATVRKILPKYGLVIFTVFSLFDVLVVGWERTIMTEGLGISLSLLMTSILIRMISKPTPRQFIVLWVLSVLGFLLRPAFMFYPMVAMAILLWQYKKQAKIVLAIFLFIAAYLIVPITYARINYAKYGYFGIQFVGDIDLVGRILESKVPVVAGKQYEYFYKTVTDYERIGGDPHPFRFIEYYDPQIYGKNYRFVELAAFNRAVVLHTFPLFLWSAVTNLPEVMLEVCDFTLVQYGNNILTNAVWVLQKLYGYAQYLTLVVPALSLISGILFLVKPTKERTLMALLGILATSQIMLTALVVYKDTGAQYGRVIAVIRPHLFLFLLLWAILLFQFLKKKKTKAR